MRFQSEQQLNSQCKQLSPSLSANPPTHVNGHSIGPTNMIHTTAHAHAHGDAAALGAQRSRFRRKVVHEAKHGRAPAVGLGRPPRPAPHPLLQPYHRIHPHNQSLHHSIQELLIHQVYQIIHHKYYLPRMLQYHHNEQLHLYNVKH